MQEVAPERAEVKQDLHSAALEALKAVAEACDENECVQVRATWARIVQDLFNDRARRAKRCVVCEPQWWPDPEASDFPIVQRLRRQISNGRIAYSPKTVSRFLCDACFEGRGVGEMIALHEAKEREKKAENQREDERRREERRHRELLQRYEEFKSGTGDPVANFVFLRDYEWTEPMGQWLRTLPYREFLQDIYWITLRRYFLHIYRKCQICGSTTRPLELHHNEYEHRGFEIQHLKDLAVLCNVCHAKHHDKPLRKG